MGVEIFILLRRNWELVSAQLIFALPSSEKRKFFWLKLIAGFAVLCVIGVFGNMLVEYIRDEFADALSWELNTIINARSLIIYAYYLFMDVLSIVLLAFCFRLKADELLFRSLAGHGADMIKGVVFYFADAATIGSTSALAGNVPALAAYSAVRFFAVLVIDWLIFFIVARKWQSGDNVKITNKRVSVICYAAMILLIFITNNIASMLYYSASDVTRYIGVFILAFTCVFMLIMQYAIHLNNKQRLESQIIRHLMHEREEQYAESKENIDVINRKCHDLKHQISALKLASKAERESSIAELEKSVMIYDSVVKTGNEILDTILTEKTFYCKRKNIQLTCMVDADDLDFIATVDLYVMLGNALDNAVEAAEKCGDITKRVIGIGIVKNDVMLTVEVDNYTDGKVELADDLPVTTKADRHYHGYGIKSIKAIAAKYNGDILIKTGEDTFTLVIGIPIP